LQRALGQQDNPALDWRVAVHECGHAIAVAAFNLGTVHRIFLKRSGAGEVLWDPARAPLTLCDHQDMLTQAMAGRAAERLILNEISSGAGGYAGSDLAKATQIATALRTQFGLGDFGPLWVGETRASQLLATRTYHTIRAQVEAAEARAIIQLPVARH
jgi:ATP-dependent Zn protease